MDSTAYMTLSSGGSKTKVMLNFAEIKVASIIILVKNVCRVSAKFMLDMTVQGDTIDATCGKEVNNCPNYVMMTIKNPSKTDTSSNAC